MQRRLGGGGGWGGGGWQTDACTKVIAAVLQLASVLNHYSVLYIVHIAELLCYAYEYVFMVFLSFFLLMLLILL